MVCGLSYSSVCINVYVGKKFPIQIFENTKCVAKIKTTILIEKNKIYPKKKINITCIAISFKEEKKKQKTKR